MWKKIFILIGILLALVYLVVAMTWFNREPSDVVCSGVELRLQSNAHHADFITQAGLKDLLEKGKLYPMGWRMDSVRCRDIEAYLMQNPFIKSAECYKTPAGHVCVEVAQRVPVLRVMGADGAQFYLEALFRQRRETRAVELMVSNSDRSWLGMIERGATCTTEAWNPELKPNMSFVHPWGSAPGNLIVRHLFGLQPTEPGWKQFRFDPRPGPLRSGYYRLRVPGGVLEAEFHRDEKGEVISSARML